MPSTSRCGVDSVLPKVSAPVASSNTAMSVNVPPISAANRIRQRFELAFFDFGVCNQAPMSDWARPEAGAQDPQERAVFAQWRLIEKRAGHFYLRSIECGWLIRP